MNEQIVSAAFKTLNIGDVSGELTEEQITELVDKISSIKVYTEEALKERDSNVRKAFRETIEKEVSGKTLSQFEKNVLQKYGLEMKQGEDYQTALELIDKLVSTKVSESSTDEQLKKELEAVRDRLKAVNEEKDSSLTELERKYKKMLSDKDLNGEISKYAGLLDVEDSVRDGQLEFLKYTFEKRYELREQDGKTVVFDKQVGEIVKNDVDMSPESLSSVLGKLAPTVVKLKSNEPKQGRGKETNGKPVAESNLSKFKTVEDFNKYLSGQEISPTSNEGIRLYSEWKATQ